VEFGVVREGGEAKAFGAGEARVQGPAVQGAMLHSALSAPAVPPSAMPPDPHALRHSCGTPAPSCSPLNAYVTHNRTPALDVSPPHAGILSSFGELRHMASGAAALQPFDPFAKLPKMSYKDGLQVGRDAGVFIVLVVLRAAVLTLPAQHRTLGLLRKTAAMPSQRAPASFRPQRSYFVLSSFHEGAAQLQVGVVPHAVTLKRLGSSRGLGYGSSLTCLASLTLPAGLCGASGAAGGATRRRAERMSGLSLKRV
jgi:hypothetical protein